MNIILTGHSGLIGSYLKKRLEQEGHKIVLDIDKREGKEVAILEDLKLPNIDMVIHAAAICKINRCIENPGLAYNNGLDTYRVLEFCRKNKVRKIVYFSSSRVLSKEKNPYTASKIYGEELCKAYKDCYGIEYVIIRPSTVYGPALDKTKRLMHLFIVNALLNKDLEVYGDPETKTLDFTYVEDFVDGVMLAIKNKEWNKEYNISGEGESNIKELAEFIINETDSKSQIKIKDAEIAQPQKVNLDLSEIKNLGYCPKISLKEGVKKNIEVYKKLLEKDPRVFEF